MILFFISFASNSFSITPLELARLAEERAPLIRMGQEKKAVAQGQVSQSKLLPNPIFTVQSGSLKSGTANGSVIDLTINQPIPWPGKRDAIINSARIMENLTTFDLEESKLRIHHSVTLMALELAVMHELEKHNAERRHRFSLMARYLSSRPLASPKQKVEKDLIETQMNLVQSQMYDLETRIESFRNQLQMLTDVEKINVNMNWALSPPPGKDSFISKVQNNIEVRRSQKNVEFAQNQIEEAKYYAKPDLLVGVNYRRENVAPVNNFYHANFSIVIPILDRGQHSVETARANARRENAMKDVTLLESNLNLNKSYQNLVSAYNSTQLFKISSISVAENRFKDAEKAFMRGQIDTATFLQTDTQIHETIDTAFVSILKYYSSLSEINLLIGEKLEIK